MTGVKLEENENLDVIPRLNSRVSQSYGYLALLWSPEKRNFLLSNIPLEIQIANRSSYPVLALTVSGIDSENHKKITEIFSIHFGESSLLSLTLL